MTALLMKRLAILCIMLMPFAASAQSTAPVAKPAQAQAHDTSDLQKRIDLATRMADLTPPRDTVEMAINQLTSSAPSDQRADLKAKMMGAFDFAAFRQTVIDDMVQTFTSGELQKMVEYHTSPEARTIALKMPGYEAMIQPQMTKMLDVSMMVARTGQPSDVKPTDAKPKTP